MSRASIAALMSALLQEEGQHAATGVDRSYDDHVNPQWVRLLNVLQMNVQYDHCQGAELFTADGRRILDFLSGYCVHNAGHNHPTIIAALKDELDRRGPAMLQSHIPELAGELAQKLCNLAGGRVRKAFFCSSGSEGVEAAIKFSRAHTGRSGLLYADGAFHGLTCGALSLMGDPFWKQGFGPLLPGTESIPFGDLPALHRALSTQQFAAFFWLHLGWCVSFYLFQHLKSALGRALQHKVARQLGCGQHLQCWIFAYRGQLQRLLVVFFSL